MDTRETRKASSRRSLVLTDDEPVKTASISGKVTALYAQLLAYVVTLRASAMKEIKTVKTMSLSKYETVKTMGLTKYATAKKFLSKPEAKVTGLAAAGGAATLGAGGGLMGLTAGAGVGAAVGIVPAIFTFGLSIPIGAFMGGAFGLCAGTALGGSAGLVGGGAAGYYGYAHQEDIKGAALGFKAKVLGYADCAMTRVTESKDYAMTRVSESTDYAKKRFSESKDYAISLVPGTGGTKEKAQ